MRRYHGALAFLAGAFLIGGCGGGEAAERESETAPAATADAADEGLIPGTPAGGLEDWIRDIQVGLRGVDSLAVTDGRAAQRQALDLYIGRQEYIELYYGPTGRLITAEAVALGAAVDTAETRFHELMQTALESGDAEATRAAAAALSAAHARVLEEARAAGVPLTPRGVEGS